MSFILLGILNSQASGGGVPTSEFELISSTTLTTTTTTVTLSSIPQNYRHLYIVGQSISNGGGQNLFWSINGNTSASSSLIKVEGSTFNATATKTAWRAWGRSGDASVPGVFVGQIAGYSQTNTRKSIMGHAGYIQPSNTGGYAGLNVMTNVGLTTAVTSLAITIDNAKSHLAGTTIQLYGVL